MTNKIEKLDGVLPLYTEGNQKLAMDFWETKQKINELIDKVNYINDWVDQLCGATNHLNAQDLNNRLSKLEEMLSLPETHTKKSCGADLENVDVKDCKPGHWYLLEFTDGSIQLSLLHHVEDLSWLRAFNFFSSHSICLKGNGTEKIGDVSHDVYQVNIKSIKELKL